MKTLARKVVPIDALAARRPRTAPTGRVFVTGIGAVTPYGPDAEALRSGLLEGRSAIAPIRGFDTSDLPVRIGGELPKLDLEEHLGRRDAARLSGLSAVAVIASRAAVADAGLEQPADRRSCGVFFGTGFGTIPEAGIAYMRHQEVGDAAFDPLTIPRFMPNAASAHIAMDVGFHGPHLTLSTACSSASAAIGQAYRELRGGHADVMLAGGGEWALTRATLLLWSRMRVLSTTNDPPQGACRPFDRARNGMVMSDATVMLVLESEASVLRRGARVLAEVAGYGSSCDASHLTRPGQDTQEDAMRAALTDARLAPADVDYIAAHGTATKVGDVVESRSIRAVFGDVADHVPVSATKSLVGHTMGASGAISAAAAIFAMEAGRIPPTLNLDDPDPECPLHHVVPAEARRPVDAALVNSFGFGGANAVLALRSVP